MSPVVTPRPRHEAPRPASASPSTKNIESMIQSAHRHLVAPSPRTGSPIASRRRYQNNQDDATQRQHHATLNSERLVDHMESFPLVPLPVIPQLSIQDLEQVERGLADLLGSLMPHESDQQLGKYAARQLTLVQQHLAQQRAQERVLRMLQGELPATIAPIATNSLRKSSSAGTVRISHAPRSKPAATGSTSASSSPGVRPRSGRRAHIPPGPPQSAGIWKSKKAAVEMARAMVQANAAKKLASTATMEFMVTSGGRKRRRPRAPAKRTEEEEAAYRAKQLELERENRRQAAYKRLLARQALQAKRKEEHKRQKREEEQVKSHKQSDTGAKASEGDSDSESDSESEASDVSNCSESDEANEKAILLLDVEDKLTADEDEFDGRSEGGDGEDRRDDYGECDDKNLINEPIPQEEQTDGPECSYSSDDLQKESHECSSSDGQFKPLVNIKLVKDTTISASDENRDQADGDRVESTPTSIPVEDEAQAQHSEAQAIALDLQLFMASRAAAKLEQLQAEKDARYDVVTRESLVAEPTADSTTDKVISVSPEIDLTYSSTDVSSSRNDTAEDDGKYVDAKEEYKADQVSHALNDNSEDSQNDSARANGMAQSCSNPQISWVDEVRQSSAEFIAKSPENTQKDVTTLNLPRTPVAECKDYRFYFANFHCILTPVFEQYQGRNSDHSSSASSLYHRPVGPTGEHTMRLQQKLYEGWQSIMHDYATVFGPKIAAPEGMVPIAAATPWAPHYRINSTARKEVCEIVTQALENLGGGWEEHPSGLGLKTTWNLLWTWSKPRVERQTLLAWQKVNHFQHAKALTRKDCLKKHIGKYLAAGGRLRQAFDIIPLTFILPKEYVAFVNAFQERGERLRRDGYSDGKNIWIMKPVALSRGRGISLVNDLSEVVYGEQVVIQEYIANPRLLDGFKFDLRLYVLVTSFNPLEAFLYDEGFVRLCTRLYEDGDLTNIFVHLTNSSIQKSNEDAIAGSANPIANVKKNTDVGSGKPDTGLKTGLQHRGEQEQTDAGGTKTTLAYLWRRLAAEGVDVEQVKRDIEEVVLKALMCGEDHIPFQVNSFDLLGYDILLDADLRPWLIEINSSPSMARENDLDYQVKDAMMLNTLRVVDPLHFDRAKLAEVIARRQRDVEEEKRRPHAYTRHPREAEEIATRQLNEDLTAILRGEVPRAYGEMPEKIGNYRRLCPHTTIHNQLMKLKRSCLRPSDRRA